MIGVLIAFAKGVMESNSSFGVTYDDDSESPRSRAYDRGRNLGDLIRGKGKGVDHV